MEGKLAITEEGERALTGIFGESFLEKIVSWAGNRGNTRASYSAHECMSSYWQTIGQDLTSYNRREGENLQMGEVETLLGAYLHGKVGQ